MSFVQPFCLDFCKGLERNNLRTISGCNRHTLALNLLVGSFPLIVHFRRVSREQWSILATSSSVW